ncbi:D-tyrosyl-tRNA(Tyr) deacylase [Endocarpon pusillum Z07020]|uniref:D-aminoacyl-tRNA deacylase n=1 Tax=Endocarpon pusillum (strain Z07020 / HMAS-L-300199) TaxID=1263415 RepID=U1HFH1_ENDPU|nr:D-tyrosyl-tRNA(Tyr) deacylase [Endocarpon pusillum Z07020]ERF68850.1 D-tyrosyl-tRNA(Tyr) deacylase [Endocarpon pusillum Z07020]
MFQAILQRVASASVSVDKKLISSIERGILVFAAIGPDDTKKDAESMASKVLKMKMWPDETGSKQWKRSVQDIDGEILCVSQFTLLANTRKGHKPDFHGAAKPEEARLLYDHFVSKIQNLYLAEKVKNGVFQAMMEVGLVNDGPVGVNYRSEHGAVTLEIDTNPPKKEKQSDDANPQNGNAIPDSTAGCLPQELLG